MIYAHRGASFELPENTIESFALVMPFLEPRRLDAQHVRRAIGFQVDARRERIVQQEWHHVIPVHALMRGRVNANSIMEIE